MVKDKTRNWINVTRTNLLNFSRGRVQE